MIHSAIELLSNVALRSSSNTQLSQSFSEDLWKVWMGMLIPWISPVVSGVVSIYVAWKVFGWQGKRERDRWILDQKKAEWRELLGILYKIGEENLPPPQNSDTADALIERVHIIESRLNGVTLQFIFIASRLDEMGTELPDFIRFLQSSRENLAYLLMSRRAETKISEEYRNIRSAYQGFVWKFKMKARIDLGMDLGTIKEDKHGFLPTV